MKTEAVDAVVVNVAKDASGRVHDVPNVYIADGSLLVKLGGSNPAPTIQALAYRVASQILRS